MAFNQYSVYSVVSTTENNDSSDILKILNVLEQVEKLQNANDAKEWVKTNWNLRDDIQNLPLAKDIKLSTRTGKNYFNITIEQDKQVKSYNFA